MIAVRRYLLVRLYLAWHATVAAGFGLELALAPRRLLTGPSVHALYGIASPRIWGVAFLLLAGCALVGVRWPLTYWRLAILVLGVAQILWAAGLLAPLAVGDPTNLLASVPWIALAVTTALIAWQTIREESCPEIDRV